MDALSALVPAAMKKRETSSIIKSG